jgi:feruloyl esterase
MLALALALALALLPGPLRAMPVSSTMSPGDACAALAKSASIVISGKLEPARGGASGEVCVVRGQIISSPTSTINFRLDMPEPSNWNIKLLMVGGGGFDGFVPTELPWEQGLWFAKVLGADGSNIGRYAAVSSDSGHQGHSKAPGTDLSGVAGNPTALRNHAYEANHVVLLAAVDLVQQYYGKPPTHRYIIGGSNGGRAGLVAIQRYPADYDGVIALEPAISQAGLGANVVPVMLQHIFASPDNWLNAKQIALYAQGELDACDALDGLKDGVIGNVKRCHYDGGALLCKQGGPGSDTCLTAGQLDSIRRITSDKKIPVTLADGWIGYAGYGRGGESSDWLDLVFGTSFAGRTATMYLLMDNIVKWGVTNDPNANVMTLDPTEWAPQFRALSEELDATDPDLTSFYNHGGKLIVWHGVSDTCVSYMQTARYLDAVTAKLGDRSTGEFMRFYISPGVGHEMRGAGASTEPLLSALELWVEKSRAPQTLTATLSPDSVKPGATRPLCQYPLYPRYKGKGDPTVAANFVCAGE